MHDAQNTKNKNNNKKQDKEMVLQKSKSFHTAMEQLIEYGYNLWIKRKHLQTEYLLIGKYLKRVRNPIS